MTGPAPLPPYGFVGIPLPGGRRYFALGPGGPVTTWQQVAGARRAARNEIQRQRDLGIEIEPDEEEQLIRERLFARGGSLSQQQYDRLMQPLFQANVDPRHNKLDRQTNRRDRPWFIARSSDPNVIAEWVRILAGATSTYLVWITGHGVIHQDSDPLGGVSEGWKTLGELQWNIQYAKEAARPDRLRAYLDPNVLQQFWSIDQYALRWMR